MVHEFHDTFHVAFGEGAIDRLGAYVAPHHPKAVLLISSGDYVDELGITKAVQSVADEQGFELVQDKAVVPNPRLEHVNELVALGKQHGVDLVIAAGGGSSIDTAKAVGIGLAAQDGQDIWQYFDERIREHIPTIPVGVISTLPGTGSEVSESVVITREDIRQKRGAESPSIRAAFTIVDPTYSLSVPDHYLAAGIADIAAHIVEMYSVEQPDIDVTDRFLENALQTDYLQAERFATDPKDPSVRLELHKISLYHHFLGLDRTGDWTGHTIEHALSGLYDLIHGEGLSIITPAWLRYIAPRHPDKLVRLASQVLSIDTFTLTGEQTVLQFADYVEGLYRKIGLRTRLHEHDLGENDIKAIASFATLDGKRPVGRYITLGTSEVEDVLRLGL